MTQPPTDRWKCAICGLHYVVPELARDCERRHARLTEESK